MIDIEKYLDQDQVIPCFRMKLFTNLYSDGQDPLTEGAGEISVPRKGDITYKLYEMPVWSAEQVQGWKSLRENTLYSGCRLFADSYDKAHWIGEEHIPEETFIYPINKPITGSIDKLWTEFEIPDFIKENFFELYIPGKLNLPYSGMTTETQEIDKKIIRQKLMFNHQEIDIGDSKVQFDYLEEQGYTKVLVTCPASELNKMPSWLLGALSICTGESIYGRALIKYDYSDRKIVQVQLLRVPKGNKSLALPPFFKYNQEVYQKDVWDFIRCFIEAERQFSAQNREDVLEKVILGFREACIARQGTIREFILSITTFIEKCEKLIDDIKPFPDSNVKNPDAKQDMEAFQNAIINCNIGDGKVKNVFKKRAMDMLKGLQYPRPNNTLKKMRDIGLITEDQVSSWKSARNGPAHGKLIRDEEMEEYIKYENNIICMMYRMIFYIVGYKGNALEFSEERGDFIYSKLE